MEAQEEDEKEKGEDEKEEEEDAYLTNREGGRMLSLTSI